MTAPAARLAAVAAAALVIAAVAAGCGSDGQSMGPSTVTVTASTSPSASPSASPTATTDVKGRAHDLGTVTDVSTVGGQQVVELDRWTAKGMSDPKLAQEGVEVAPHRDERYSNQNTEKTYTAIVAPDAQVVVNTCVVAPTGELGQRADPEPAATWLEHPDRSTVLAITYDEDGRITRMDTDPRCR